MKYSNIIQGVFISRPNRFIANVEINGAPAVCHVKNTGRCAELLVKGAIVYLQHLSNPARKTEYDLIAVRKGSLLINMDSAAPNKAASEYLRKQFGEEALIKPEVKYGASRLDFYIETPAEKWFIEVKGVTLECDGRLQGLRALYRPDERGKGFRAERYHSPRVRRSAENCRENGCNDKSGGLYCNSRQYDGGQRDSDKALTFKLF